MRFILLGLPVASAEVFGDSWGTRDDCVLTPKPPNPCKLNKQREAGAHKACSIIKLEKFRLCHMKIDPQPFYERCVYDTCGCNMVGDCECTCQAIAAYSYACLEKGVVIDWRTGFQKCGM